MILQYYLCLLFLFLFSSLVFSALLFSSLVLSRLVLSCHTDNNTTLDYGNKDMPYRYAKGYATKICDKDTAIKIGHKDMK